MSFASVGGSDGLVYKAGCCCQFTSERERRKSQVGYSTSKQLLGESLQSLLQVEAVSVNILPIH